MLTPAASRRHLILTIAIATGLGGHAAHAQSVEAETLFNDGDSLMKQGKLAQACDAFEGSNRMEPRAGTLIRLGECREQNHQLASAWSAYKDALARVKDPKKKQIATDKVKELEARLSYLTVSVSDESRIDGLEITRNGQPFDPALWNRAIPVNGGQYTIGGHAPGRQEWKSTVTVADEKANVTVDVPKFKDLTKLVPNPSEPVKPAVPASGASEPAQPEEPETPAGPSMWTGKRKAAAALGGVAVASVVVGALLGKQATGKKDDAYALCPDPKTACAQADQANTLLDAADGRALGANICFGVAAAAAIGAGVLWFTGAPKPESSVAIVPGASSLSVVGRF